MSNPARHHVCCGRQRCLIEPEKPKIYGPLLAALDEVFIDHAIRAGFFKLRLVKNGPFIPAIIYRPCPIEMFVDAPWNWLDRWPRLAAKYDSDSFGRPKHDCEPIWVWKHGVEITVSEYRYWMDTRQHIRLYEPDAVDADPFTAIDLNKMAPRGPRKR